MSHKRTPGGWCLLALGLLLASEVRPATVRLSGVVRKSDGKGLFGVFVTAKLIERGLAKTVLSGDRGRFTVSDLEPGTYRLEAKQVGWLPSVEESVVISGDKVIDFSLSRADSLSVQVPSSAWLGLLPEGDEKRRFILDCTGCHQFNRQVVEPGGARRTEGQWRERTEQMLSFAGWKTNFPIISAGRDADKTAAWLANYLGARGSTVLRVKAPPLPQAEATNAVITEFDLPKPFDLPHDLQIDAQGRILITGMFSHVMYTLDPAAGRFTETPIPVQGANPRALDLGADGAWWVLLGGPQKVAKYDAKSSQWQTFDLGMYPHSVGLDREGGVWFNGHFTKNPAVIARLDPQSGAIQRYEIPNSDRPVEESGPIPYEIRAAPDGTMWGSELAGNRVYSFDRATEQFTTYHMPTPHSGPRRLDIAGDGTVWIPEYAGNALTKLDPRTGRFTRYPYPSADALPYVVRIDRTRGIVWIATAANDAVAVFDPRTERFVEYPLPTRGALIRHIDIDAKSGALWAAYGPAPAIAPKIARVEVTVAPRAW